MARRDREARQGRAESDDPVTTAQGMAIAFRERDERRREREERRPKNAGVHADQNKRHRTRSNRRAENQDLRQLKHFREA